MKFLINIFICLLFISCLPVDVINKSLIEAKEHPQGGEFTSICMQLVTYNVCSKEDAEALNKLVLLTSVSMSSITDGQKTRLGKFIQWLGKNQDKIKELAEVGKDLQNTIKIKEDKHDITEKISELIQEFKDDNTDEDIFKKVKGTLSSIK
ncbi:hypothetical protein DB313_05985 (plasmid) [Borrelia turcica IST7]|uniref:Uncharacterized protein n=1 Tax=Borrelia turcica IST7 TaxID=1104446 RepID=A0A386PNJ6_9SPIR|nr:hypothetical protein [Borrelia turcica]AYE37051.1 hypothetical protein DB313_05985 [Borrelia turcica IST7]